MTDQVEQKPATTADEVPAMLTPAWLHNPYPTYEWMRRNQPVGTFKAPSGNPLWLITRYQEAQIALADTRLSKDFRRLDPVRRSLMFPQEIIHKHMLNLEAPDHTRLRRIVSKAFTPRRVEELRPRVEELTTQLLDAIESSGDTSNLIDTFAFPLPLTVIYELLGIPSVDRDDFRQWTNNALAGPPAGDAFFKSVNNISEYVLAQIDDKRRRGADDLLTALISVRDDNGDQLSEDELVSMTFLLLAAGYETTVNLIGNGIYHLLAHPDQRQLLQADPELVNPAVEEILRFESPVLNTTLRLAVEDVTIGGVTIPADEIVLISLGSAHRDEDQFADANRFDITRTGNHHLAFGHGHHYCLGAPLARMEGRIALREMFARFPRMELAADPQSLAWRPGVIMRGLVALPVTLNREKTA